MRCHGLTSRAVLSVVALAVCPVQHGAGQTTICCQCSACLNKLCVFPLVSFARAQHCYRGVLEQANQVATLSTKHFPGAGPRVPTDPLRDARY
eukprot:3932744-Rhodomonas_salina.3